MLKRQVSDARGGANLAVGYQAVKDFGCKGGAPILAESRAEQKDICHDPSFLAYFLDWPEEYSDANPKLWSFGLPKASIQMIVEAIYASP